VTVGAADVLVFDVAGVLFYTDALELATELVSIVRPVATLAIAAVYWNQMEREFLVQAMWRNRRAARAAKVIRFAVARLWNRKQKSPKRY
jgi:hypothetical protein